MAGELTSWRRDHGERSEVPREETNPVRQRTAEPRFATRRVRVLVNNSQRRRARGLPGHTPEETVKRLAERFRGKYPDVSASTACSLLRQHMPPVASADSSHQTKHPGGRPRVNVQPGEVQAMRDGGASWRNIGKALGISPATAIKLYRAGQGVGKPFENSRPGVQRWTAPSPHPPALSATTAPRRAIRAALYCRASTAKKAQTIEGEEYRQRPEIQEQRLRALSGQRGWDVVAVYTDRASGRKECGKERRGTRCHSSR